ncbi:MAG: sugar ABC transporter substrate-binding protein [Clostridiales bacterium]|nr:sugar ABC transporter substrate-binding protein [Clostridiales bacterium]
MKKKVLSAILSVAMVATLLTGCGNSAKPAEEAAAPAETTEAAAPAEEAEAPAENTAGGEGGLIGVAMPTKDLQRWNQDGSNMEAQLKEAGYEVDLQYASNDIQTQVSQIENMISNGCQLLVIASIDGDSLGTVLAQAKEANIPVIAYDRLIMNSDAVTYYATFDNYMVGTKQGEYIRDALDLDNAEGPFNIELITGDPGDNNARFFFGGAMDVLQPYIDNGKLVVKSGQTSFEECATANWATETAQARFDAILASNYSDGTKLDAVLASNDSTALGVANSLAANYTGDYPILTGQDCDIANVKNMIDGKQSMSIFKDTRTLATQVVKMVDAIMKGGEAPVNDTESYDNGTGIIPSYLCEPVFADKDNYKELLIDSGYYTEADLQ